MLIGQTFRKFCIRNRNFRPAVLAHSNFGQKTIATVLAMLTSLLFGACGTRSIQRSGSSAYYPRALAGSSAPSSSRPESPLSSHVVASWYGPGYEGHRTATGEVFDPNKLTAASKTLPLGSVVRVTNVRNGRSVNVRINDQ
ncbi:MAG: septal ring lytic transglycosylase RlpA family protein [Candidatus Binatia bacterium]